MDYQKLAAVLSPMMDEGLHNVYNLYISKSDTGIYICNNFLHITNINDMTFEMVVAYAMETALSEFPDAASAIEKYRKLRTSYKRSWYRVIKNELGPEDKITPQNPRLLYHEAQVVHNLSRYDRSSTPKEISVLMDEQFKKIKEWKDDPNASITSFHFFPDKSTKSKAYAFVYDIVYDGLNIIKEEFHGQPEGYLSRFPVVLMSAPIFNYRNTMLDFELTIIHNELRLINNYDYKDGQVQVETSAKLRDQAAVPSPIDLSLSLTGLQDKYNIETSKRDLDLRDREIVNSLYSLMTAETVKTRQISGRISDLAKDVFVTDKLRSSHLKEIEDRLYKIQDYSYRITIRNKETEKAEEQLAVDMISKVHTYTDNGIRMYDITPSDLMIQTYVNNKYVSIMSKEYHSISSVQTRSVLIILQMERILSYMSGELDCEFSLNFFKARMKMNRVRTSVLRTELERHLSILKEEKLVVDDFEVGKSDVKVRFRPLSEIECVAYGVRPNPDATLQVIDLPLDQA